MLFFALLSAALSFKAQQVYAEVRKNMNNGDIRRCVVLLDSCLRAGYREDSALYYKTLVHVKAGEKKAARKCSHALYKKYPDFKERRFINGLIYFLEENYGKSIDEFNLALESDPGNVKIIYNRSIAFGLLEEYLAAIEDLSACIGIDPANAQAYYSRAYWYEFTGNYREAAKDYENSLRLNGANCDARLGLANTYKNLYDAAKACEAINAAVQEGCQAAAELRESFCK